MQNKTDESRACPIKKTSIGGQALLEGVMMRGPHKTAMAVRHVVTKEITLEEWENKENTRPAWTKWPVVRGIFNFVDSMITGYKCLMRSATLCGMEDELEEAEKQDKAAKAAKKAAKEGKPAETPTTEASEEAPAEELPAASENKEEKKGNSEALMSGVMVLSIVLGLAISLFLFKFIPETLYELLAKAFPAIVGAGYGWSLLRAAFTGVVKIAILVGYMAAVSFMKDIRRTFCYHGAEHKSIFCYEQGLELTVENVKKQQRFHPRCGTSFLVLAVLVSVFVTMFIPAKLVEIKLLNILLRTGIGLLLLPIIMGFGYELIRLAGRKDNALTRIISAPGMWLQHITTREPDEGMIECAIASLKAVIPEDPEADRW